MNIQEKLTERIKEQFVNLLTDEELEEIIKKEIDSFFDEKTKIMFSIKKDSSWDNASTTLEVNGEMSPIRSIVFKLITDMTAEKIKSESINNYFKGYFTEENGKITRNIDAALKEAVPLAINSYFTNIAQNMTMQLQHTLMNNGQPNY